MHHMCGIGDKRLVAGCSVALVLDTSCCTGTFVYCTWGSQYSRCPLCHCADGFSCGTNTVTCCMWESLINWHRLFVVYGDHC